MSEINITNLPASINHTIYQGDSFVHHITIKEGGVLVDLTGDDFTLLILNPRGGTELELEVGTGVTIVSTGNVKWELTGAQTDGLTVNCPLKYSFRWDSREKTIEAGQITVVKK